MVVAIGEVLFDVFPEDKRIGGAPFNFVVHLANMGFPVHFVTRVGKDANGRAILDLIHRFGLSRENVQVDPDYATGRVMVHPEAGGGHRFDIVAPAAYDYLVCTDPVMDLMRTPPDMVYFGTLAQRSEQGRRAMEEMFQAAPPETRFFCDINLRPGGYDRAIVDVALQQADLLKLNDAELAVIGEMFDIQGDTETMVRRLMEDRGLVLVALTLGSRGGRLFTLDDHARVDLPSRSAGPPVVDTVGAGDAFAAVTAAGFSQNRHLSTILEAATEFAGRICGIQGAVPDSPDFYRQGRLPEFFYKDTGESR